MRFTLGRSSKQTIDRSNFDTSDLSSQVDKKLKSLLPNIIGCSVNIDLEKKGRASLLEVAISTNRSHPEGDLKLVSGNNSHIEGVCHAIQKTVTDDAGIKKISPTVKVYKIHISDVNRPDNRTTVENRCMFCKEKTRFRNITNHSIDTFKKSQPVIKNLPIK